MLIIQVVLLQKTFPFLPADLFRPDSDPAFQLGRFPHSDLCGFLGCPHPGPGPFFARCGYLLAHLRSTGYFLCGELGMGQPDRQARPKGLHWSLGGGRLPGRILHAPGLPGTDLGPSPDLADPYGHHPVHGAGLCRPFCLVLAGGKDGLVGMDGRGPDPDRNFPG